MDVKDVLERLNNRMQVKTIFSRQFLLLGQSNLKY